MMFNYYGKLALRNLLRFKGYTAINVIGLSFSMMVCLLIVQHIADDLGYDKHHQDSEQIYRVATDWNINGEERTAAGTPSPLAENLKKDFPEVLDATRIYKAPNVDQYILEYEDKVFFEKLGAFADPNFFDLLTYDFIYGKPSEALDEPLTIVLSDKIAEKFFGNKNPIGKAVQMTTNWGKDEYRVTGVFDSETYASHLETGFYAAGQGGSIGQEFYQLDEWAGMNLYYTYLKLNPKAKAEKLNEAFPSWLENYAGDRLRELGIGKGHFLQPIEDIYLDASVTGFWFGRTGNKSFVYILACIAGLLLLIACINFMNLATAKATIRAQEVGTRKVLGANRGVLVYQFMSEAFIYASLAVVLAFGFAKLALPVFNNLTDKNLGLPILQTLPYLLGFIGVITLLAGSYPALYLSSFSPSKIFKNNYNNQFSTQRIRQGLVIVQFIIGIALIQGVFIINQQLDFIGNKDLGYDPSAKIVIPFHT
ncbi:MAG: ABC transporter permease [Bacteroidota bacterium]